MKRSTFFIFMLTLLFPLAGISQNQSTIVDDIYYKPGKDKTLQTENTNQTTQNQNFNNNSSPNYKNGAKEIIYTERKTTNPTIVHDTVYVVGMASDVHRNGIKRASNLASYDSKTGSMVIHDTIYVADNNQDNVANQPNDSTENNQEQGYYLNGFNGNESDMEYAERIRRFHNPKYEIFIGDPRYNDIYFLNNSDWNVYVDGSYAYVTPTWTNPYWWNYNIDPYFGGFGWGGYGYGWNSPWGFNNFYGGYGLGDYYGYGYGYPYYGYGGYYGYGYGYPYYGYGGYGGYGGFNRNKNYDEGNRREIPNYNGSNRLGGTRNSASSTIGGGTYSASNQFTTVTGSRNSSLASNTSLSTRTTVTSNSRITTNSVNGIGIVRANGLRFNNQSSGTSSIARSNTYNINTRPRTYTTSISNVPTGNTTGRQSINYNSTSRSNYSTGITSRSSSNSIINSSNNNYRSNSPSYSRESTNYSSGNSGSSYSGGGRSSGGSSSGGGGGRSSGGGGGGRR
ncbi:MAG: hypothetical protein P4L34_08820 [Paludibacter sp.]|nr:hypothetical protein [Paludibacter sp.]